MKEKRRIMSREVCSCCDGESAVGFSVPDDIWEEVSDGYNVLCLDCFIRRADRHLVPWDKDIKFFPVSLATHLDFGKDEEEDSESNPFLDSLKDREEIEHYNQKIETGLYKVSWFDRSSLEIKEQGFPGARTVVIPWSHFGSFLGIIVGIFTVGENNGYFLSRSQMEEKDEEKDSV